MNRNIIWILVVAAVACGMVSCRLLPKIVLFNHTGQDITITQRERTLTILSDTTKTFFYPGAYSNILTIMTAQQEWTYRRFPYPPSEYCQPRGRERIKMQIESDGAVYVLSHTNDFPLKDLLNQPDGFPMRPETKPNQASHAIGAEAAPQHER